MKVDSRTLRFVFCVAIIGAAMKYLPFSNAAAENTGSSQEESVSLVNSVLSTASGMLPMLGITQFGEFTYGQPVQISGKTYNSAVATSVNLSLLGSSGIMNIAVNPNPKDAAVKISGQLAPINILPNQFSIKACCQKDGGPDLNVEVTKNNIRATVFRLNGAIRIPTLKLDSDVLFAYENGVLVAQTEKHDEIDAVLTIKIALPDPRRDATGVSFTLGGNFSRMLNEYLRPLLSSWAQDAASRCQTAPVDTSSAKGFLGSITKKATSFVQDPEACGKTYLVDAVNSVLNANLLILDVAQGSWNFGDMQNARAPKLDVLTVRISLGVLGSRTITLNDLQFDFKNPSGSAADIAGKLFGQIKQLFGL